MADGGDGGSRFGSRGDRGRHVPRSARAAIQPESVPQPPSRSRRARNPWVVAGSAVISVLFLLAIAAGAGLYAASRAYDAPGPLAEERTVVIPPHSGTDAVAGTLEAEGVIDSPTFFRLVTSALRRGNDLKAGEYLFQPGVSLRAVLDTLVAGRSIAHKITVPEGLTSRAVADLVAGADFLTGSLPKPPPEGSVLPDTYKFDRGTTREEALARMKGAGQRAVAEIWKGRSASLPLKSPAEMVTLASIVERETARADERPRVAAVFLNRLKRNMRLGADSTVIYGLSGGSGRLDHPLQGSETRLPNPYNTYLINGLPPGPIANPGRAALEAVANPSMTNDLYFVADGTGGHAFAATLEEQNRNINRWHAAQAAQAGTAQAGAVQDGVVAQGATQAGSPQAGGTVPDGADQPASPAAVPSVPVGQQAIVIDPGMTSAALADRLRQTASLTGTLDQAPAEGSVLPDTYRMALGTQRADAVTRMQDAAKNALADVWRRRSRGLPLRKPADLVVLASIVEREATRDEDKPRLARVLLNRLQRHMKLESDASVAYGRQPGTPDGPVTDAERQAASPYNTWAKTGLPPGPICNPSLAALGAVARPASGRGLYYERDAMGALTFSASGEEHRKRLQLLQQASAPATPAPPVPTPPAPTIQQLAPQPPAVQAPAAQAPAASPALQPAAPPAPLAGAQAVPATTAGVGAPGAVQATGPHQGFVDPVANTAKDPLLDHTYDLNSPQTVPPGN